MVCKSFVTDIKQSPGKCCATLACGTTSGHQIVTEWFTLARNTYAVNPKLLDKLVNACVNIQDHNETLSYTTTGGLPAISIAHLYFSAQAGKGSSWSLMMTQASTSVCAICWPFGHEVPLTSWVRPANATPATPTPATTTEDQLERVCSVQTAA